jgi:hypothetical protein
MLAHQHAWGNFQDVAEDISERLGKEDADEFLAAMNAHFSRDRHRQVAVSGVDYSAEPALMAVPAPFFLDALELAVGAESGHSFRYDDASLREINRVFSVRGVSFRFTSAGAEWHGDEGAYEEVIRPALDALQDPRLSGCRHEFDAALRHLRAGTLKDQEDAIEEAGKAVESAMKVVLQEHGVTLTGKETAQPLWNLLRDNQIVPPKSQDAILGTSRLRNEYGGHGQGGAVRQIPAGIAELATRSAATAVAYLAERLP